MLTQDVGKSLLSAVRQHDPDVTPAGLLRLEFQAEETIEMPLVWVAAQTLLYMWAVRLNGKTVDLIVTRSVLETRINLLIEKYSYPGNI